MSKAGGSDRKEDKNQMLEDEEWIGIRDDDENDNRSEDWKTDDEEADDVRGWSKRGGSGREARIFDRSSLGRTDGGRVRLCKM